MSPKTLTHDRQSLSAQTALTCIVFVLLFYATQITCAQDGILCANRAFIGQFNDVEKAHYVESEGDIAYLADADFGVFVLNISNPEAPTPISKWKNPGYTTALNLHNQLLFVSQADVGTHILNVSNPALPTQVGYIDHPNIWVNDIYFVDNLAYIVGGGHLYLYDVSEPVTPMRLSDYVISSATRSITVRDNLVYLAGGNALVVYDFEHTESIELHSFTPLPERTFDLEIVNQTAYIAGENSLIILDISNSAVPQILSTTPVQGSSYSVLTRDNLVYLTTDRAGIQVFDASTPASPAYVGSVGSSVGYSYDIKFNGEHILRPIYSHNFGSSLDILDVSNPTTPIVNTLSIPDYGNKMTVSDDTLYIAANHEGVLIYDISDSSKPLLLSEYTTPGRSRDIAVSSHIALVAGWHSGAHILDVSDPSNPTLLATSITDSALSVDLDGNLAYVLTSTDLIVLDIETPTAPQTLSTTPVAGNNSIIVRDRIAFIADEYNSVELLDMSDPLDPQLLWTYAPPELDASSIAIQDQTLYISDDGNDNASGLHTIDISDPANPMVVNVYSFSSGNLYIQDDWLYSSDYGRIDIYSYDRGHIELISSYYHGTSTLDLIVDQSYAFISSSNDRVSILDISDCNCIADFNSDGTLNYYDVPLFIGAFSQASPTADLNHDGEYNFFDIAAFLESYLAGCP